MDDAVIRSYRDADAGAVAACLTAGATLDKTLLPADEDGWRRFASRTYNLRGRDFMVAERGGRIIGVLMSTLLERDGAQLRSVRIIVHPNHRRRGIATRLFAHAQQQDPERDTTIRTELAGKWKVGLDWVARLDFSVHERLYWMTTSVVTHQPTLPRGLTLRPYEASPHADEIWRRLNRDAYEGSSDYLDLTADERDGARQEASFHMHWADVDGTCAGLCHTKEFSGKHIINSLVVDRRFRGRGIGRTLLLAGMATIRARGIDEVWLSVRAENEHAVSLYRSVGFDVHDEHTEWWRPR